jgi:hypothetical protein
MNTPDKKQILRDALLQVLDQNRSTFGLPQNLITEQLRYHAVTADKYGGPEKFQQEIAETLDYLVKHQLVEEVEKILNRHVRCWRLTQAGFEYVDVHL